MPATPKPTEARGKGWTRRWQVLRAAGVRYFHAYGSWLVSISWWRFLLISILVLILAAITALEVSTYYIDFGPFFMPSLMIMMVVKFVMVVSYFMHLKFDNKIFSWLFYAGLFLAIGVYVAFLSTFKFFIA